MYIAATSGLTTIGLDVKAVARTHGADLQQHSLLPPQVLALTRHWLALSGKTGGGKTPPAAAQFEMMDVGDIVPYLTILRVNPDNTFTFTFTGSAVSAIIGEDLTGRTVTAGQAVLGEIDWFRRCRPVAEVADIQVLAGAISPSHTSPIDFIAADFPLMDDAGGAVTEIVGVTVARLN
ncbi:MAG: hypothetical protein K2P94_00230 [Rhodospirillaceae bacterium]|nr:hypothetical protein [Rhodospirillaceae bacterium]